VRPYQRLSGPDRTFQGHGAPAPRAAQETASTREYRAANDRMHRDMAIRFTGNADRDPLLPDQPTAAANRRVSIILLRQVQDPGR
jgi:hypothetical protein